MTRVNLRKIKELRKKAGMTQKDMALLLGYKTLFPYFRKENGKQPFKAEEIIIIARHFGVPVENFFEDGVAKNAIKQREGA